MSTITYLDSHCHLFDEAFESDFDAVLSRAAEAGVTLLNIMCTSWQEADRAMAYAEQDSERIKVSCGIFPTDVNELTETDRAEFYRQGWHYLS